MRFSGSSSAPAAERQPQGNLRGYVLDGDACAATADTFGVGDLAASVLDNDGLAAQPLLLREIADDDQVRASPGILALIQDDDQMRATADLADFGYERDFVLRAFTELAAESLTDFVVLNFQLSGSRLKTVANGGRIQHASAYDVLFQTAAGAQLDHSIVEYDGAAGTLRYDLRIPTEALASDFRWRMRYGRPGVSTTYGNPAGCYRRALAVWEWSTGLDLTGRNRDLTSISGVTLTDLGGVGPAGQFAGTSFARALSAAWANGLSAASLEIWVAPEGKPSTDKGMFRLGGTAAGTGKLNLQYDVDTDAWQASANFGGNIVVTAAANSFAEGVQHLVLTAGSGLTPKVYKNGALISSGTAANAGNLSTTADDYVSFGTNPGFSGGGIAGKYGRAILWPFALSPAWIAASYAIQSSPAACIGMGPELTSGTANRAPVAVPMFGAQDELESADYDVAQRSYDAESDTRTASVPSVASGVTASIVAGKVRVRPDGGTGGRTIDQPARVTDGQGRMSDTIIRVRVGPTIVQPPPPGSILPALYQYNGTVRPANTSNAQSIINNANDGDIVVLAAGNYGTLSVPANKSIWVRGATAPFTGLDCTPVFSTADEMTSATDHSPRDRRVTGLRSPSDLARGSISVDNGAANVRISNFYSGNAGGIRFLGSFNRACVHDVWLESIESRGISVRAGTPTDYRGTNPEYVEFRTIIYADSRINGSGASGGGEYTDYGTIIHGTMNVYIEDTVRYGGFNHGISFKGGAGKTKGLVNRNVFASWNQQNAGGNTNQLQLGQNIDNYNTGGTVGDITCGPITVTACTFIGFNHPSGFRLSAISFQNAASLEVSGSVFGRFYGGGDGSDGGNIRMVKGDGSFGGPNTAEGARAWRGDLYVHDNSFNNTRTFTPSAANSGPGGADYENCRLRFERNTTPGNGILIVPNGHPVTLGANSGFRTS